MTRAASPRWAAVEAPAIPPPMTMMSAVCAGTGSVKPGPVTLRGHPLALDRIGADLLGDDAAERRPLAFRHMFVRIPQIGPDQRLAAVAIDFLGGDQDAASRHFAVDG